MGFFFKFHFALLSLKASNQSPGLKQLVLAWQICISVALFGNCLVCARASPDRGRRNQWVGCPACVWGLPKQRPASLLSTDHSSWIGCAEMFCLPLFVCLAFSRALFGFSEDCFEVTRGAMFHLGIGRATQSNIFKVSYTAGTARGC